jgi:hypothetical protein
MEGALANTLDWSEAVVDKLCSGTSGEVENIVTSVKMSVPAEI